MEEQRLTVRLIKYWELIRKNKPFPQFEHLNAGVLEELWQQCFVASVNTRDKANYKYKYEYMGDFVVAAYGSNLTGTVFNHKATTQFSGSMIVKKMNEVVSEHRPVEDDGYFVNEKGTLIKYRACFLPFGNKKNGLTHVLGGLSYRAF